MSVIDEEGYPAASIITAARADGLNWVAFCTGAGWNKPKRLLNNPRSSIYLFDEKTFSGISLVGQCEVVTVPVLKQGCGIQSSATASPALKMIAGASCCSVRKNTISSWITALSMEHFPAEPTSS